MHLNFFTFTSGHFWTLNFSGPTLVDKGGQSPCTFREEIQTDLQRESWGEMTPFNSHSNSLRGLEGDYIYLESGGFDYWKKGRNHYRRGDISLFCVG